VIAIILSSLLLLGASQDAAAHNREGTRLFQEKRFARALVEFRKARDLDPESGTIRANLGHCLLEVGAESLQEGDLAEATDRFDEAVDLIPDEGEAHYRLGVALHKQRIYPEAIARLEAAVKLSPEHREAYFWLGKTYYDVGDPKTAIPSLEEALRLDPENGSTRDFLARVRREAEVEEGFDEDYSRHFLIKSSDRKYTAAVRDALEKAFSDVATALSYNPEIQIPVVVYEDREFREVTRTGEWVGGVYDGKIRIPVKDFDRHQEALKRVIRHEVTHALLRNACKDVPLWFNEGLAQYLDGSDRVGAKGEIPDLHQLDAGFRSRDRETVTRSYALSLAFLAYLAEQEGEDRFGRVVNLCRKGDSFEEAFRTAFWKSPEEYARIWRDAMAEGS
jgi:tetratricopeptide (TPR) repeat protein